MTSEFSMGDFDLSGIICDLITSAKDFDGAAASSRNLIDPFAAALESVLNDYKSENEWLEAEHRRTKQKNLMNHIGDLQQAIIGKLPGWTSYSTGTDMPDVVGKRGKQLMLCEVKNKHNTMNSRSSLATYDSLVDFLGRPEFKGYTAGVVAVIAPLRSNAYFKPFAPSGCQERKDIVFMSGRVFYTIATDIEKRVPYKDILPSEDFSRWKSWKAIDLMIEEFWSEIEKQTKYQIPRWIKDLTKQALGA